MYKQTVMNTAAGRFLVDARVARLVEKLDADVRAAAPEGDRYRIARGVLEHTLDRYATPLRSVFVTPRSARELEAVAG